MLGSIAGLSLPTSLALAKSKVSDIFDVIIIGLGAAGAAAAIEAADKGCSVLIVEKQKEKEHCPQTRLSSGIYLCPDSSVAQELLKEYIVSTYVLDGLNGYKENKIDPVLCELADVWSKIAPTTADWLAAQDPDYRYATDNPYTSSRFMPLWQRGKPRVRAHIATYDRWTNFLTSTFGAPKGNKSNGEALYTCLLEGIAKRPNIRILFESKADNLIFDHNGRVSGIRIRKESGGYEDLAARKGVVLATGGFGFSKPLREAFFPLIDDSIWATVGSPHNKGEGLLLGLSAGASIVSTSLGYDRLTIKLPKKINDITLGVGLECMGFPGSMLVDNFGRRYISESSLNDREHHFGFINGLTLFDYSSLSFPRSPSWLIFDEPFFKNTPLVTLGEGSTVDNTVRWNKDNINAVNNGWILKGNSLEELAEKIRLHPENLCRMSFANLHDEVKKFNSYCEDGLDQKFDRSPATLKPINTAPFYAMPISIDIPHMAVGLRTNEQRQVVNWERKPIEGLYAAGEVAPVSRFLHDRGGHLSECLVFGRYVGKIIASRPSS